MYGNLGDKLVLEAKRSINLSEVPLYQGDLIKEVVKETLDLNEDAEFLSEQQSLQESSQQALSEEEQKVNQCQLFVTHLYMRRNKRCLLAYEKARADKIDEFCWLNIDPIISENSEPASTTISQAGSTISPFSDNPSLVVTKKLCLNNLDQAEEEYFKNYLQTLINYKSHFADIDLSGSLEPPKSIFIDVRVLKNGGEVQTEYGVFNLIKDSQFYVRKSDVERLIQQGYLEEI